MIPETYAFIEELTAQAHALGIEVLVEIHSHFKQQVEIASRVDWVYDFALPPLLLHAIYKADARPLVEWLTVRPNNAVTVLDTHDGIGVIDVGSDGAGNPGLLDPTAIHELVEEIHNRSRGESRMATGAAANNLDLYQVNCTYYDALGQDDIAYLIARAVQLFVPGIPQIYYVGLLAGTNDMELLAHTGIGRDINRHNYTLGEVENALSKTVVQQLIELIRLRNKHLAFGGTLADEWIRLNVNFATPYATIEYSRKDTNGNGRICLGWNAETSKETGR
jgi:sucrose phosphorylase